MSDTQARKTRILLVEDEDDIRNLYSEFLFAAGYDVSGVGDGTTAAAKALAEEWDLMLLDIMLPGQDGTQILKAIKSNDKVRNKPVIVLTNLNIESVAEELFDMGADGFLVKSEITPDKIAGEIQTVLQKYA
ncbi:TPA: hypothetical protein DCY43_02365 [candidate division WWE3 bacterium]|uniref:Transcriptional regulatory protein resD n=4 Tax=Katanobacteria TaxID=422282 RepID=A0A0G1NHZ2_UNCKA|nr:MAG: Transcriptional regulatory protein resD [candidate division WWE3 bacterium GW2011_GWA2_44_16]KKT83844.1 MAG: Transcriptional regulatory protein resD [candidate division WWE3 bacterium GW2011_GWC2_44_9]OGC53775.1 MAG: hypothetical protein A2709_02685 [candidate division WWE3 bacterium RIFCSPHIGHO2_01_FULL_43_9]HAZ29572.1 hypothetical protein [candidate division WWE3 bacterium]